jgi:hypothetical protein
MNAKTELHIIMPGICGPLAELSTLKNNADIDNWIKFLSRSNRYPSAMNVQGVVAALFNLPTVKDIPSAALTMLANDNYAAVLHYMHADPVHLRADLDHAVLTSSLDLAISEQESMLLCNALNQHFNQDGLTFIRLNKDQWLVSSENKITINTTPLVDATGRNINFLLPHGEEAGTWNKILTEAQMLMHSHEINISRENSGQQSINSLWFYGCGELPEHADNNISSVCSDHDMLKGLARHNACDYLPVPVSPADYMEYLVNKQSDGVNLLHISGLEHLINYTDVSLWLNELGDILNRWLYPLVRAAHDNNIKLLLYPCNGQKYHPVKYDALKFWKKGAVEQHISSHKPYVQ